MKKKINTPVVEPDEMNIIERMQAPTPKFFRILRSIGLGLAAVGGVILTAPVALPVGIVTAAGYITLAAGVASAVSQTAVQTPKKRRGKQ